MRLHTEVDVSGSETGAYHGSKANIIVERRWCLNWGLIRPCDSDSGRRKTSAGADHKVVTDVLLLSQCMLIGLELLYSKRISPSILQRWAP
jgi:hypothetical protein